MYSNKIDYFFISLSALIYEIYKICNTCILVYTVDCISINRCPRVETVWSLCIYSFIGTTYPEYSNIFSNLTQSDVNTTAYQLGYTYCIILYRGQSTCILQGQFTSNSSEPNVFLWICARKSNKNSVIFTKGYRNLPNSQKQNCVKFKLMVLPFFLL